MMLQRTRGTVSWSLVDRRCRQCWDTIVSEVFQRHHTALAEGCRASAVRYEAAQMDHVILAGVEDQTCCGIQ